MKLAILAFAALALTAQAQAKTECSIAKETQLVITAVNEYYPSLAQSDRAVTSTSSLKQVIPASLKMISYEIASKMPDRDDEIVFSTGRVMKKIASHTVIQCSQADDNALCLAAAAVKVKIAMGLCK